MMTGPWRPLVVELQPAPSFVELFSRLRYLPHCLFLDSARRSAKLGRYSFLAADPFEYIEVPASGGDGLQLLADRLRPYQSLSIAGLPPFQGGAAGLLSYDLGRSLERLPAPQYDEFQIPSLAIGLYDVVIACDHQEQRTWILSHGFPAVVPNDREIKARHRLRQFHAWIAGEDLPLHPATTASNPIPSHDLSQQHSVQGPIGLTSNFSKSQYLQAVTRAIEYIRAGDLFQVNLAQRLLLPAQEHAASLYLRLRERNPATFAGYFDLGEFQIVSASPERFLQVHHGVVEARPIKGTRKRSDFPEADLFAGDELQASEKDRAENVMIVDLLRNDLSRVCLPDSVRVTQLCQLETYEFVQHLVSAVTGHLRPSLGPLDLLRASFPGGSITGAPKVRAMEIIAELEPTARGAYCGCLGYLGFDGSLDTNILIRTFTAGRGWWQAPVGGGIVAQSVPEREYEETWQKAEGLLRALKSPAD